MQGHISQEKHVVQLVVGVGRGDVLPLVAAQASLRDDPARGVQGTLTLLWRGHLTRSYDEFSVAERLRMYGWVVPAYTLARDNDKRKVHECCRRVGGIRQVPCRTQQQQRLPRLRVHFNTRCTSRARAPGAEGRVPLGPDADARGGAGGPHEGGAGAAGPRVQVCGPTRAVGPLVQPVHV